MNIIFFGNWGLAKLILKKLVNLPDIEIKAVVTQYDASSNDEYFNAVYNTAKENDLNIYNEYNQLSDELLNQSDIGICISYSKIFSKDILSKIDILNLHPAKLPEYRGPSPILWQLKTGANEIGATIHFVDDKIDCGDIVAQSTFSLNYNDTFNDAIDSLNQSISEWFYQLFKVCNSVEDLKRENLKLSRPYYHRITIPSPINKSTLYEIKEFLNRKRIAIFSGNRAEFGIILPLIQKLSEIYYIDLIISGAHVQSPWLTKDEVYRTIREKNLPINVIEVNPADTKNYYKDNFTVNFNFGMNYFKQFSHTYPIDLAVVLGDRVETYAFANAAFFSQIPICHLFGGDISNVPYFDTNIRHAITKISNLHFVTNKQSFYNLLRMGEEDWRCHIMGNISLDNYTIGNTSTKQELLTKYELKDEKTFLITYHPSQFISAEENFKHFLMLYNIVTKYSLQTIITFPNNDEGHQEITQFLAAQPNRSDNLLIVKSLGIKDYLGVLKELDCIVIGNSSSGLFETAYSCTPTINIGDRQTDRPRAINVSDLSIERVEQELPSMIDEILKNYDSLKDRNRKEYDYFGTGNSVNIVSENILKFLSISKQQQIFKKFVIHQK
ncbi:MAG: UDP-N-acetylglucosamine 2-epimerase [Bacteroidota bacterium]